MHFNLLARNRKSTVIATFFILFFTWILTSSFQGKDRVSASMESRKLFDGKVVIVKAQIYYTFDEGKMIMNYTYPNKHVFISNALGEAKVYYPERNEVSVLQNTMFSTENDVLYYFMSGQIDDLGLRSLGFQLAETDFDDNLMVTTWMPPGTIAGRLSKIEMVHENYIPIYSAYYTGDNKVQKKIYYSDFLRHDNVVIPQKVTEIEFLAKGDSIISRKEYSDFKFGASAMGDYFNFKVPEDAKIIDLKK